jgi:hypothetical protein
MVTSSRVHVRWLTSRVLGPGESNPHHEISHTQKDHPTVRAAAPVGAVGRFSRPVGRRWW